MRIHRITLRNYRGTVERTLEFRDGVTVVEGRNEVGKSTLVEALRHLRLHKASTSRKEVRDTQPVGRDVGPEAEVELSTGEYHLTYCKRWLKGKKTELNITAPHPEKLSGDDAHERFLQVVAETTDDGLFEALEVAQGNSLGQANLARLPALRRALDGAGPSTGEHDALLEAVEKEYLRYFTPTGKPTGDYAQGQKDLEALTEKTRLLEVASQEIDSLTEKHEKAVAVRDAKKKRLGQARQQETEFGEESRSPNHHRRGAGAPAAPGVRGGQPAPRRTPPTRGAGGRTGCGGRCGPGNCGEAGTRTGGCQGAGPRTRRHPRGDPDRNRTDTAAGEQRAGCPGVPRQGGAERGGRRRSSQGTAAWDRQPCPAGP